jgi:SAM-dependent methyltransferase
LNYAESHRGFAAQRGLWFNPAVSLEYAEGDVRVSSVSERIIEVPYAFRALGTLPVGSRILDLGATESTVALSLAALGYRVTAIDLRMYPLPHANLTTVAEALERWTAPPEPFDAALALSSIEHFGLGSYGESAGSKDADVQALRRVRKAVRDNGLLVLTVPYGKAEVGELQRTYDRDGLRRLLAEDWKIEDCSVAEQVTATEWKLGQDGAAARARAVALITARAT